MGPLALVELSASRVNFEIQAKGSVEMNMLGKLEHIFEQQMHRDVYEIDLT